MGECYCGGTHPEWKYHHPDGCAAKVLADDLAHNDVKRTLDIGCGDNKRALDAIGLDVRDYPDVDVVANVEDGLPFEDGRFEEVLAYSILEHVSDLPYVMAEIHRVCRDGALVRGKVPHYTDRNAYIDPTHKRFFDVRTFDYWDSTTEHGQMDYFASEFRVEKSRRIKRVKFWQSRPIQFELSVVK